MTLPTPITLRHLARLCDEIGIAEHARLDRPDPEMGYCTDDAGRLLAIVSKLSHEPDAHRLATVALYFLAGARDGPGSFRLRRGGTGAWTDDPPSDDATGRALLGLGTAVAEAPWPEVRAGALEMFDATVEFRSAHPRAIGHAALGAVAVLGLIPGHEGARRLVADAADLLPPTSPDPSWPWPEPTLTYSNALIPEARLAVAVARHDHAAASEALSLLRWLITEETGPGWFSFAAVGGHGPGGPKPAFDQQPIEAWAMANACARAFAYTGDSYWADGVRRAADWFAGYNDVGIALFDPITGGGFDGLEPDGVNRNQGAESTMAAIATMAQADRLGYGPRPAEPQHSTGRALMGTIGLK